MPRVWLSGRLHEHRRRPMLGFVYLDAMVPADGETAVDVMPINQLLLDQAASWRIPPLPEELTALLRKLP